jgi:8-oxo-dGTP pyrophosphatase MutT (NUDIX family)
MNGPDTLVFALGDGPDSLDFMKGHIKGYAKKDGTYVKPHERNGAGSGLAPASHPHPNHKGEAVTIHNPHAGSAPSTWHANEAVATFLPDGDVPLSLNGVPLRAWKDHPTTSEGWDYDSGINDDLDEPPFKMVPGKVAAAGVIIEEPDGRVWLTAPTNGFGGYDATFPKGTAEEGLSLQANAIKEAYEETGLRVQIVGFLGDYDRTTSKARFYLARRIGGTPSGMGWESQAVHLVPRDHLYDHLNGTADHKIAEDVGAGPMPPPKPKVFSLSTPHPSDSNLSLFGKTYPVPHKPKLPPFTSK